jgi:signal transduction histidine kinase
MKGEGSYSTADLRAIAEAGVSLTSELSLEAVLQKLVDLASTLVDTQYAAMSVVGRDGGIEQFIYTGISEAERRRIGSLPRGRGLLGVLLQEGTVLRLENIASHPRSAGFPPHHPPMRSLLGVPLVRRGTIIGNLYLSEKVDGLAFSDRDEEIIHVLATQAVAAIDNAELYQSEYRLAHEWKALLELGRQVSSSFDLEELLPSVVSLARDLLQTDVAAIMVLLPDQSLSMAAHSGTRSTVTGDKAPLVELGIQRRALGLMEPVVVSDARSDERPPEYAKFIEDEGLVSMACVPMRGKEGPIGTISVGNRYETSFDERAVELVEAIGNYAGMAVETARLQEQLESLARLEERERIAMDLHDGIIQSVYAVSLHLEGALEQLTDSPKDAGAILDKSIDDLHGVVKDIRSYIFDLRPKVSEVQDLPGALRELADDVRINTPMTILAEIPESLGDKLEPGQALGLFHIAQESLNNITKHAEATNVHLRLGVDEQRVFLEVEDDGRGFHLRDDGSGHKHGMRNMRDRARAMKANLFVDSEPGQGTIIRVELPIK